VIEIRPGLNLDEDELVFAYIHASGPGGQNVNKVATAVQLRYDVRQSRSLPAGVRNRLMRIADRRISNEGVLIIDARRHRTREANRRDAVGRLVELIARAAEPPKPRRSTAPTRASRERRLDQKKRRSRVKKDRRTPAGED